MKTLVSGFTVLALLVLVGASGALADLREGLVFYVPFEEGAGETVTDEVSSLQGIIKGASWVGDALMFDGTDDYVDFGEESEGLNVQKMTAAAWINRDQEQAGQMILTKAYDPTNQRSYFFWITPVRADLPSNIQGGAALIICATGTWGAQGNQFAQVDSETVVPIGEWVHIAGTYDGSEIKIYINGKLEDTLEYTKGIHQGSAQIQIGRYQDSTYSMFAGIIDEVMLWDRALSAQEIKQLVENGLGLAVQPAGKLTTTWASIKARG